MSNFEQTTLPDTRLGFRLPEITRYSWVSDGARTTWETRMATVKRAWANVELATVGQGVRRASVRIVEPGELTRSRGGSRLGDLHAVPIGAVAVVDNPYLSGVTPPEEGQPYALQVALARTAGDADALADAWRRGDQTEVARLLGYPSCCAEFFERVWRQERWIDTTWPMALASGVDEAASVKHSAFDRVVAGPPSCNILLRWLGIRAVHHLPCRFDCEGTAEAADAIAAVAADAGFAEEFDHLGEMLRWPVEWTALHGVAIVKTPVVTITTTTDATAGRLRVRRFGSVWPEQGATGTRFPFREPQRSRRRLHIEALHVVAE